jgi:hypothetical protein
MQVRECFVCDGLYKVNSLMLVRAGSVDSGGFLGICYECYSLRLSIPEKKISLSVDNVNRVV